MIEELINEYKIHSRDKLINNKEYSRLEREGGYVSVKASDIKVGDIIRITDERVPADVVILSAK